MEKNIDKFCFILCIIIYSIGILLQLIFSFSTEIWVDETFSINLIARSYCEIINITAADVHPPLYYLILKFFTSICNLIFNDISLIIISKIFSIIPYIILPIIIYTKLQKYYGKHIVGLLFLSIIYILEYGVEIRMYSWAMLFVVLSYIYLHEIINNGKISDWIIFVIAGILAAYTHYFACVSIIIIYISLLLWILIKNKNLLKKWVISVISSCILYLPWVIIFIKQVLQVSQNYWIEEITMETINGYISFIFNNNNYLSFIILIICVLLLKHTIKNQKLDNNMFYSLTGFLILIGTILIGIVASIIIRPVFIDRYMFPAIPCFYMGITLIIYMFNKKSLKYIFSIIFMISCIYSFTSFYEEETKTLNKYNKVAQTFINNENSVFITDDSHIQRVIAVSIPKVESYLYNDVNTDLSLILYENISSIYTIDEIKSLIESGKKVYFAEKGYTSIMDRVFIENDITYKYLGEFFFEIDAQVYELKK